jgi:putative ABC transport system permease protein
MLSPSALLLTGLQGLRLNPGRSVLAGLGIVIGAGSLTLLLAISAAVRHAVASRLDDLGSRQFLVRGAGPPPEGQPRLVLHAGDASALARALAPGRAAALAQRTSVVSTSRQRQVQPVTGAGPGLLELRRWSVAAGRPLLAPDLARGAPVAVVGPSAAAALFVGDPLGQTVRVDGLPFVVVGVTAGTGLALDGTDVGRQVLVPLRALPRAPGEARDEASMLVVEGPPGEPSEATARTLEAVLRERHGRAYAANPPAVVNLAAVGEAARDIGAALSAAFLLVALIALGVGGIGIMNVMLAGAAEREREVGIRLALGATPIEVFGQFLVEAVALCAIAGLVGEALAAGLATLIAASSPLALRVSAGDALACMAVSGAVGLVFGLHPARRAARVSPGQVLRAV